ncbi:MAG: V-type ATP synthase subunit A [Synergistaceae bacterium]|jgi:V/A-type H+-transporting ATPase subunit A|nr:V-type ATP synthase subunit A [Synergistaceae bacterium]
MSDDARTARVKEVSGSLVVAEADSLARRSSPVSLRLFEAARVGRDGLLGEVLEIRDGQIVIQLYEDSAGLSAGEEVLFAGEGLSVDLGPGFLGEAVNGAGFPLGRAGETDFRLERGFRSRPSVRDAAAPRAERRWRFRPSVREGDRVGPGSVLGTLDEGHFLHRVMVPPLHAPAGVAWAAPEGDYTAREAVCRLSDGKELSMTQRWEIRVPRPVRKRLSPDGPFVTGQSALDALFPLVLGGTAVLSGESGTGKTLLLQSLAQCRGVDAVVCIVCGERSAEAAELLEGLSRNKTADISRISRAPSQSRVSLMERTALIVSASDMPLATREASVCLGMTLAEYYRDMGYGVAVLLDSASRCAEALAETGARLREGGSRGDSAECLSYGASRLSACFDRAGRAEVMGPKVMGPEALRTSPEVPRYGSVTLVAAESERDSSPSTSSPGAFGAFWKLDRRTAQACRFPALDLSRSHSPYKNAFPEEAGEDWPKLAEYLKGIVKDFVRYNAAPAWGKVRDKERKWSLFRANVLDVVYRRQESGIFRDAVRSAALLRFLKALDETARKALIGIGAGTGTGAEGRRYEDVAACVALPELLSLRELPEKDFEDESREWLERFALRLEFLPPDDGSLSLPEVAS